MMRGAGPLQYQTLKPDRILLTQQALTERIAARFPGSGLSEVAGELVSIAQEAAVRAEQIRRPNLPLRIAIAALLGAALALGVWMAATHQVKTELLPNKNVFEVVELALRAAVFLGAVIVFLISLEIRLKRRRALAALHELRAIAHVVDMHQVAKDPDDLVNRDPAVSADRPQTTRTLFDLNRYLHYCSELLAIISKIAALYVQDFPDAPTVSAVDQVETLCSGLSQRIWQKIMILDEFLEQQKPALRGT
jgi:hypothetical protein